MYFASNVLISNRILKFEYILTLFYENFYIIFLQNILDSFYIIFSSILFLIL